MATTEKIAETSELCAGCGATLAHDQRYCLSCGTRRADPRVPFREVLTRRAPATAGAADPPDRPPARDWTPMIALGALGGLALVLVIGVLIGKTSLSGAKQAAAPKVIQVGPTSGTTAAPGTTLASASGSGPSSVKTDWPAGKEGYTVELGVLPKSSDPAAVAKAKSDAGSKGASGVGVLDSDQWGSLPGGNYLVYSGVFDTQAQARAALKKLKSRFRGAQVVHVSKQAPKASTSYVGKQKATLNKSQLTNLNNLSGDAYAKQSRKLPTTTVLPGKPPPTDHRAPGGGSGAGTSIK